MSICNLKKITKIQFSIGGSVNKKLCDENKMYNELKCKNFNFSQVSLPEVEEVPPYSPQHHQHHSSVMALYATPGSIENESENQPLTQQQQDSATDTPSHQTTQMMVTPAVCYTFFTTPQKSPLVLLIYIYIVISLSITKTKTSKTSNLSLSVYLNSIIYYKKNLHCHIVYQCVLSC